MLKYVINVFLAPENMGVDTKIKTVKLSSYESYSQMMR